MKNYCNFGNNSIYKYYSKQNHLFIATVRDVAFFLLFFYQNNKKWQVIATFSFAQHLDKKSCIFCTTVLK